MSTTLDRQIFTETLYKSLTDLWLPDVDLSGKTLNMAAARRWFAGSPAEKRAFDTQCRDAFAPALDALGPKNFPEASASPIIEEIRRIASENDGEEKAAWTALSFMLLLDQIPRNVYRTDSGLRLVYKHYDRMAYTLARSLLANTPIPRPDSSPLFARSMAHRLWFYMPLMHSEDIEAHVLLDEVIDEYARELEGLQDVEGSKMFLGEQKKAEKEHREILDQFGRYPHRNAALARESTAEEKAFLEGGGKTFGVADKE